MQPTNVLSAAHSELLKTPMKIVLFINTYFPTVQHKIHYNFMLHSD